MLGCKR